MVRRGFTLAEMLVALAVLAVAMAVVTTVFSLTTQTAQQSTALAEVHAALRAWEIQLREDLQGIDPARSILVLVGRTQAAALTEDDIRAQRFLRFRVGSGDPKALPGGYDPAKDLGADPIAASNGVYSDPRADLLMFFTRRAVSSQAPSPNVRPDEPGYGYLSGARFAPVQVVYGHAALDAAVESPPGATPPTYAFANALRHIETETSGPYRVSVLPAQRWRLARRQAILEPPPSSSGAAIPSVASLTFKPGMGLGDNDDMGRIVRCYMDATKPGLTRPGDVAEHRFEQYLEQFGPTPALAALKPTPLPLFSPYSFDGGPTGAWPQDGRRLVERMLYPNGDATLHHVATAIEAPPANLRSNLGLHSLAACAWFQVEFLMPEDPRNGVEAVDTRAAPPPPGPNRRTDMPRWTEVNADPAKGSTTYVFVPDAAENRALVASEWTGPKSEPVPLSEPRVYQFGALNPALAGLAGDGPGNRRIRMWPYAIRVTVRVFDPRGRLAEPIVRSVVHRFD